MGQLQETKQKIGFYYENTQEETSRYLPTKRTAEIVFVKKSKDWTFEGCTYKGLETDYTLNDWKFLELVAKRIQELLKELNS